MKFAEPSKLNRNPGGWGTRLFVVLPAAKHQPRHYTVPLYVDKAGFLRSLQVPSEQQIVLLLTDKAGHVLWREAGPVTDVKKAALTSFLSASSH